MIKTNYHTHTWRCHHAGNYSDLAYVDSAVQNGFHIIGFSDHAPWPYRNGYVDSKVRMEMSLLPDYVDSIRHLAEKSSNRIKVFCGMECEYFPGYMEHLLMLHNLLDYLILGFHYLDTNEYGNAVIISETKTSEHFAEYADGISKAIETGLFSYIAHPDLILYKYSRFDREAEEMSYHICEAAVRANLPLEFNLYGYFKKKRDGVEGLGYPCKNFWQIASEVGCSAIIGWDAHMPSIFNCDDLYNIGRSVLKENKINTIETLPGLE